ncbi:MAG: TOBE domain-containing protein [Desulfovibrio sp.]|jgi:molybdate transport system regulatory protein|nr:TOBE domain-containing protein [Desulfovibrio sp.]
MTGTLIGKTDNHKKLTAFLRTCSADDLAHLRRSLLRHDSASLLRNNDRLSRQELLAAESYFWKRAAGACGLRERLPRLRIWLIFMLLRYGGLRLAEIFALRLEDMHFKAGYVSVAGAFAREVPFSLAVSRRLRQVLDNPEAFPAAGEPTRCDASYVRRSLLQCSAACGMSKGVLNARALRHSRAVELGRQGLPLPVVDIFLGRRAAVGIKSVVRCDPLEAEKLLREQLQKEFAVETSARNVFQGRISALRQSGLLVEVVLVTAGGLRITAIITDESYRTLSLSEGMLVNASVKAPWVMLQTGAQYDEKTKTSAENYFLGSVERVREDGMVAEVLVALPEGSRICALQSKPGNAPLRAGDKVTVMFKAFSVIVHLE